MGNCHSSTKTVKLHIPILLVSWNVEETYFTLRNDAATEHLIAPSDYIVIVGHRRLLVGQVIDLLPTSDTHTILSVHINLGPGDPNKEVHIRVPNTALTRRAQISTCIARWAIRVFQPHTASVQAPDILYLSTSSTTMDAASSRTSSMTASTATPFHISDHLTMDAPLRSALNEETWTGRPTSGTASNQPARTHFCPPAMKAVHFS
ncbi:hypothetical protein EIP86_002247 [Pleurotus ostreatoroseus]|nr:hypothetical protein EIP86_002247 [Pleurotus ostreatoroseus]